MDRKKEDRIPNSVWHVIMKQQPTPHPLNLLQNWVSFKVSMEFKTCFSSVVTSGPWRTTVFCFCGYLMFDCLCKMEVFLLCGPALIKEKSRALWLKCVHYFWMEGCVCAIYGWELLFMVLVVSHGFNDWRSLVGRLSNSIYNCCINISSLKLQLFLLQGYLVSSVSLYVS